MKTPTFVVVVSLAAAIIVAASLLIATSMRGHGVPSALTTSPASLVSSAEQ
jgi:hypothetical protein